MARLPAQSRYQPEKDDKTENSKVQGRVNKKQPRFHGENEVKIQPRSCGRRDYEPA